MTAHGPALVSIDGIEAAARRLGDLVRQTPLLDAMDSDGLPWLCKCENLQVTGSFKVRGACHMLARMPLSQRRRGVVTFSSGNHAQAVAYAARRFGVPAVVVMPTTAPAIKVEGARALGAEVVVAGTTSDERQARAEAEATARGLTMVPPFEDVSIIEGQGTVALEILEVCPEVRQILVPIGGGGLIAGVAAAVKQRRPAVRIIGVEPAGAATMRTSLQAGAPIGLHQTSSIADGLLTLRPGPLTFAHAHAFVDQIVTVEDEEIARAVVWLVRRSRLVVETSGAASVAAILGHHVKPDRQTVAILTGGNIAPPALGALLCGDPAP